MSMTCTVNSLILEFSFDTTRYCELDNDDSMVRYNDLEGMDFGDNEVASFNSGNGGFYGGFGSTRTNNASDNNLIDHIINL